MRSATLRLFWLITLAGAIGVGMAGCAKSPPRSGPLVVTTTGMVSDLVKHVAGDTVTIQELMGPGVDPHLYQPKQSDLRWLDEADIVFYNGLHLEGNMAELFHKNP